MDFNQILLFTSLGLLVLIVLFALWGFLGGLKRELKCIAVFIVLLVLFWLVFGDEATLMNAKFGQQVASILNVQNDSITTIWDAVLAFARANIPNGETLLVEGKETYALFYSVAATIFRAIGLMAGTIVVLIICPIIRLITHIIWLIVRGVKKNRAKKESKATDEQPVVVASEEKEEKTADQVVIASNKTSADEAVITKEENELPVKPKTKKRWWGALAGALKGVFVIILVFAPVSGLCTILNTATPETQAMVSDLINGKQEEKTANTSNMVETVFDFAEAYENSAVGKFVESSSYFFGKSFSQSLFDILLRIETKNQTIGLNDELINVVEAANELNGKTKLGSWTNEEVKKFLEQLKDSKLLVEAMPVAIEYAYEVKDINKYIVEADQGVKFLELRYNNWKKDLPTILNTVAKVYELDIFPLDEFNYLTMDATQLKEIVNELSKADIVHSAFPIAIKVALKLDVVENNVGEINPQDLETIDWKKELNTIVDAYQIFQDLKITTLKDVDFQVLAKEILNDDVRKEVVFDVVDKVLELQLADRLLVPVGIHFASKQQSVKDLLEKANQVDAFMDLQNVITLNDVKALVSAIRKGLILVDITDFPKVAVNYFNLNVGDLRNVVSELNNVSSLNNIIDVALHIALSIDQVKEYVGTSLDGVDFSDIHWASDLMLLTDIYEAFLDFDFETVDDITNSKWNALIASIVEDEIKFDSAQTIVEKLASLDAYIKIGAPAIENVVEKLINEHAKEFANILEITSLTSDEWKEDLLAILDVVKAVNEIKVLEAVDVNPFDYKNLDLTSIQSVENFKKIVDKVLSLHLLGDDELKNKLVLASIRQYGWVDDSDKIDLKDVNWQSEKEVLIHLIDTYSKIVNLEVFDIYDVKNLNWQELLESDAFIDSVVEALDNLVDSNVFLELLPNLIDKYVLPRLENIEQLDDDTLISDILDKVSSEELVQEVIKLIDVVKAAVDLGLFNVNKDGINAVDLANTDALKDIVSGILGSKLIEGNEGRVIRVILKATGILNIEKGSDVYNELISIDYTNEKDILLEFIDKITPVLKDETFKLVDEEGKFKLDLKFWAENENAQTLLEGAKVLFGSYEENTTGSNLITALLPAIYDKFVDDKNLIPDDFITIVDELNVTEADGKTLSHDISCLIYVLEQLVKVNAQSFLDEGSVEINDAFALAINNIIDALHDIELIKNHEKETLAWGVNYIAKLLNIELDAVNTDFENVDWQGQKEVYKEIVNDLVALLVENNITNVNQLKGVFDEIIAGKSKYVTDSSVNELLNILDQVADVQVIDAVLPLAIKFVVKLLDEKGIALDYLNEFTSVELAEDFHKIIEIAHIAVDEGEFVKYYQNGFDEKLALPKEEVVHSIIHEALQLHILADADGRLLSSLYEKFVAPIEINGEPIFLKAEDFDFANIDWSTEEEILHSIVRAFYDLAEVSDFDTIAGLKDLVQNQSFKYKPFFTDEVGYILVDLLRDLEHSQLVKNVIVKAFEYAIDTIENSNKIPFSIVDIKGLTAEDLMSCISPLAEILDIAIEVGVLEYVRTNDIAVIDVDLIADAIEKLGKVDRFTENVTELLHKALQYVANLLNEKLGSNIVISVADVEAIDIESECNILAQAIRSTKGVFEANDLVSLKDIIDFVKGKEYQSEAFINSSLAPVVCNLVDLKIVQLFLPGLLDALVDKVTFVDLSFLKNSFTGEELASDMKQLTNAIDTIKDAELVSVLLGKTKVEELNLHIAEYAEIVEVAKDLYVLNKKYPELASALINKGLNAIQSEQAVTKKLFEGITFADEAPALIEALKQFELVANQAKFVTVQDIIDVTKDKKFYENEAYVNENVVYPLIDTLEELTNLQTLEAMMQVVGNVITELASNKNIEIAFLFENITNSELLADVKLALDYARDTVRLGGLEYVTTKDIANFDPTILAEMVEGLYDFNVLHGNMIDILDIIFTFVNTKVKGIYFDIDYRQLKDIDYNTEFAVIASAIAEFKPFMEGLEYTSLSSLMNIFKNKDYVYENFYNETSYKALTRAINTMADSQILGAMLPDLLDYAIQFAYEKGYDIIFLKDEVYTTEFKLEDIRTIANILDKAYDFGIVEYVFNKNIEEINDIILNEILEEVGRLHVLDLFTADLLALGINKGFELANIDITVTRDEFVDIVIADEVHALQGVVTEFKALMNEKGLKSLLDITDYIKAKNYNNMEFFDETTGGIIANILTGVTDVETIVVLLPKLLDYGLEKIKDIDLLFLKGIFTKEELRSDLRSLAMALVPAIRAGVVKVIYKQDIKQLPLEIAELQEVLTVIQDMNILNKAWPTLASKLTNYALEKMNSVQRVTEADFAYLTFAEDVPTLIEALDSLEEVLQRVNATTINDMIDIFKNKEYKDISIANKDVANAVLMSLEKAVDAHNIQALLPAMFKHVCEQLTTKGIDVDYLFAIVTNEQIVEDVYTILHTSKELVDFGIIEFVLADGEIQLDDFSALHYAIESILGLHVMNGNQPNAIITLFKQLKVETETIDLFDVNWTFETDNLQAMLEVVRQILARFELNTISKIKAFNINKLITVNDGFNDLLDLYDELLTCIANDQVISKIILPVSKRYLENVNYKELISLHNIYHNASEFQSDILGLQKIVAAVRNLDLNGFLRHGADYPFRDSENIQTIISQICDLYYLNNENRLDQILNFIDSRVEMDLSEISAEGIDLRADADKFIQIYEHFVRITESKYWTMNKNGDKFDIRLLGSTYVLENMLDMTDIYMDTTVYDKTGFAILLFALPVVKFIAPNYYEALELGKVTISMLEHDQTYLEDIIQTLVDLDITNVITNGSYFTEEVHQAISSILDDLFELEIGKGHANAFFTELVNDLVDGKTIQGVEVPEGTIVFETTSFRSDRESLNVVLDELYALFASENITTISDFKTFMNNLLSTSGLKDFLSKDSSWDRMENIANAIYNMTFVGENGLSIMNNIVTPILEQKGSKLAKYVDLSDYTNELFMNDIRITKDLISSMKSLGVAGIIRDEEIAYGKVEDIQNILVGISELYYMESHMDQIIDFLSRRLPFSIDALHSTDFAFANDMLTISEAYPHLVAYLTSSNNPFKTLSDITDFVKGGFKVTKSLLISTADYLYDFADAYDLLVNVTALALVAPEFAAYVKPKLPEKFQGLANVVSVEGMSFSEVQADLRISSELLRNLIDFGIADILDNKDVTFTGMVMSTLLDKEVTRAEMINMIIENIRHLICLSDRSGFVLEVLELMQVDTTTIDFSGVDWEVEFDNLETLVVESIAVLEAHDLHTWKEIVNYIKSINQFNVKSEMKRVVETIQATIEHIVFITETLDSSTAFNQLFKPLYNKYVFPKLPTNMYNLGNLDEYTITDLDEDMTRLAVIARALKEMKDVPGSVKDNATSDECIIPTQRIIEEFFSLNLLNQKKQEIVYFIDTLNSQIDLSTLDVTNVDLANDGKIFAQYAKEILIIYKNMIDYTFTTTDLANTELMDAVITIYNGCVDTDSIQVIANWVYSKYIAPIEEERHWVSRFDTVDETVAQIAKEFGFILEAFLEMGVFSNDGIDFTNKVATDKLFGIFENVYIFTDQRMVLIDMLKEGFEELGVIPFSYENIRMNNEIKVVRDVFRLVRDFMNKHLDDFKQNVLETLDSYAVQNEIDEIISCMFESMIVKQLALPVINGMTKIYTRDIYEITIFEGMTEDEFRNSFMSDVYDIIEKARELKVSGRYFDYTNVDSVIGLLDIIVNRTPFSSHLEELVKYVLYILDVDVRDEYFGNIDWSTEYSNFRLALQEMSDAMSGVVISDVSTMKNNTFLSALAEALPYLNNSELLPLVARQAVEMFINKIDDSGRFNYYINRLYNSAYTNELLMKDYRLLPEIIKAVVDLGYFDGGINYQQLDPVVDLLELFFEVEFVKGDEVRYFNAITKRVDLISSYDIDYTLVIDWDAEKVVLINAVKELVSLTHLIDINHLTPESFNDKVVQEQFVSTIDAMSKSIIGQQLVPQLYADKVEPNLGHSDYQGVIDFSDPEFTPDCWASEFEKFFEAYNILQKYQYGSKNMTLVNADAIELMTILFGTRENKEAGIMTIYKNPKVWLNRLYDNNVIPVPENAIVNSTSDRDWNDEPYRIIDVLKQMDNFTTSEGVFTYDKVYNCQDEEQLHELLETVNNCVALRETILPIILNTMEESAEVSEALANAGLIDAEFDAVCDEWRLNGTYDADYWTVERIEAFARVIAQTNANA